MNLPDASCAATCLDAQGGYSIPPDLQRTDFKILREVTWVDRSPDEGITTLHGMSQGFPAQNRERDTPWNVGVESGMTKNSLGRGRSATLPLFHLSTLPLSRPLSNLKKS